MKVAGRVRIVLGWTSLVAMVGLLGTTIGVARWRQRTARGDLEAATNLAIIVRHVAAAYERTGKLCGGSLVEDENPFSWRGAMTYDRPGEKEQDEAERLANTGFYCLQVTPRSLEMGGKDMYTYEVEGDSFTVRAFRAYLYDPEGVLVRYERRGSVRGGRLVIDPELHEVAPGGPRFKGHPDASSRF